MTSVGSAKQHSLPGIVAGSWVYGDFSTWIGSKDKNHAWDLLCVAKQSFDMVMASGRLSQAEQDAAEKQLCSCESSDWFWWFGDYNPSHAVASFDRLFRHNLTELYHLMKLPPPLNLTEPISLGSGSPEAGGAMRRASEYSSHMLTDRASGILLHPTSLPGRIRCRRLRQGCIPVCRLAGECRPNLLADVAAWRNRPRKFSLHEYVCVRRQHPAYRPL